MEALYRRYATRVNGLAFRLLGRDADLDDVVQESFARVFTSLRRLRQPELFWSFLASTVTRTVHKVIRRRRLLRRFGLGEDTSIDLDALVSHDAPADVVTEVRQVYAVVDQLPAKLRVPLVLRRVEGLSLQEVADLVGASLATVKRRLAEAEQLLEEAGVAR